MFKTFIIYLSIMTFSTICLAQRNKIAVPDKSFARELFVNGNYKKALDEYLVLIKNDSSETTYKHNLALCYLNLNIEKTKTVKLLEDVIKDPESDPNVWYDLALAYQKLNRFEDALIHYRKFITIVNNKDKNYIPAKRQIEMCENAKILMLKPINVKFENLGNEINCKGPDLRPYISSDESFLVYTSKRTGNIGNLIDYDGFNTADIFTCNYVAKWNKPRRLPAIINTLLSEDCTGLSADGSIMTIHYDSENRMGDILISELKGKSFLRPVNASLAINSDKEESAACLSPDKQTMFFASNREGGEGAKDLYYSRKLPSGEWSEAINLGSNINTIYDENFPYLAPDGEMLYFCSVGHNSMGGYDIFKAKWDKETYTFSKPENIGFPVNTSDDERTISFTQSGRYAYMDAVDKSDNGERDLYKITFNDIPAPNTVITGKISTGDTINSEFATNTKVPDYGIINITVVDKNTALKKGKYKPNKITGKYVVILPPGEYVLKFEGNKFDSVEFELIIPDRENTEKEINKDILLTEKAQ